MYVFYCTSSNNVCCILCLLATVCIAPDPVEFNESNKIGETVTTIVIQENVTLQITANPHDAFGLIGNLLVAKKVLDYEVIIPLRGVNLV